MRHIRKFIIAAATAILAAGAGAAYSSQATAPEPLRPGPGDTIDESYVAGESGIDFAAVTGPRAPASRPACRERDRAAAQPHCGTGDRAQQRIRILN
jgi:hypothetical protein